MSEAQGQIRAALVETTVGKQLGWQEGHYLPRLGVTLRPTETGWWFSDLDRIEGAYWAMVIQVDGAIP